ncbi:DUF305 domain-containing protein [Nostoc sp. T09]|uniref:DUF4142 domain-containing protein n=1 Tax=Nostoc sp. T09 TaxID=1932621 RepID=UPI000A3C786E|nr:DUF4142 domain-containing protein [Nostoc sp. T09]OUL24225.1 DUF305 domain-containing protein [Nostoc sp. T09]
MLNHTKGFKTIIGSFLGVAAFISLPGLAQANLNSVNNTSNQYILAQNTSTPGSPTSPGTSTPNPSSTDSNTSVTTLDTDFMTKAAQSDLTEIQTSQLALRKSRNKAVRSYARQMIQHHTASSKKLAAIAKAKNFTLPKDIGPDNKALLTKLQSLSGNNFNQAYMQGQTLAHQKTLAEYQRYLQQGQDQDLIGFANQISPLVAQHLQMAQKMTARP